MNTKFRHIAKSALIIVGVLLSGCSGKDWQTASREPAGIAPVPSETNEAVIEFYAADAFSWRGWFAVHPGFLP